MDGERFNMYRLMGYYKFTPEEDWRRFDDESLKKLSFKEEDYNMVSSIMQNTGINYYLVTLVKV